MKRTELSNRGILKLSGSEVDSFLQGLISNDVTRANGERAIYAALLTPQGKFLYDFFIVRSADELFIDCREDDLPSFSKKLKMYKLRSDVTLEDVSSDYQISVIFGDRLSDILPDGHEQKDLSDGAIIYRDPRLLEAGIRVISPVSFDMQAICDQVATETDYQVHRIQLGLPESPTDLITDKSILLESGFDELNGVDWKKGCYMGQELTARTKYRGLIKKRLVPFTLDGDAHPGDDVILNDKVIGDIRSVEQGTGIAMIKIDALRDHSEFKTGAATISVRVPGWVNLPEAAD